MNPAEVPQGQGADPNPSLPPVDGRRLQHSVSVSPDGPVVEVLGDDNLLIEILVRLPPKPSSLPRASVVCKQWGSILSDPLFFKRFRKHHRKPPLLGFFRGYAKNFIPAMDSPDRIPAARFSLPKSSTPYHNDEAYMGCRHGLSVLIDKHKHETVVWDPLTGEEHIVAFPPWVDEAFMGCFCTWHSTVLCADAEDGHVHGDCFSSPFKLVLVYGGGYNTKAFCTVYDSASGVWGNIFSATIENRNFAIRRSILVGNALCWLISGGQELHVIKHIVKRNHICHDTFYPYRNFYTAGRRVGTKGADLEL